MMTHHSGMILSMIRMATHAANGTAPHTDRITIENRQANGTYGVHQATVRLAGDPTTYRLILAPADTPIEINGRPIGEHFAKPLGDG